MKFLLFLVFVICAGFVMAAPPKNPCSTVDGKTYCTGLITPDPAPKNPCSTVNGKTYCTGLILPPGGPGASSRRRRSPRFVNVPQQ